MGPKEMMMIGLGVAVLLAVVFLTNWIKSRSNGNNGNTKNQS